MAYTIEDVCAKLDGNMSSLSPTSAKVVQLANDINCPPAELTRVIKLDPVLSARVLKLVNSSYFSLSKKIVSLEKAVIMLGLNTIRNLALSAAVLAQVATLEERKTFDTDSFWRHSLGVGVAARMLAEQRGMPKKEVETFFIAGLMHNLGLLAEVQVFSDEMVRIMLRCRSRGLPATERKILGGLDHCVIGEALARTWGLSPDLTSVLAGHHDPDAGGEHSGLLRTVFIANALCKNNAVGMVIDTTPVEIPDACWSGLGLDPAVETEIMERIESEIDKATEFLQA